MISMISPYLLYQSQWFPSQRNISQETFELRRIVMLSIPTVSTTSSCIMSTTHHQIFMKRLSGTTPCVFLGGDTKVGSLFLLVWGSIWQNCRQKLYFKIITRWSPQTRMLTRMLMTHTSKQSANRNVQQIVKSCIDMETLATHVLCKVDTMTYK